MSVSDYKPRNYEEFYNAIKHLIRENADGSVDKHLQELLVQKICTPRQFDLWRESKIKNRSFTRLTLADLLNKGGFRLTDRSLKMKFPLFVKYFIKNLLMLLYSMCYLVLMPRVNLKPNLHLIYGLSKEMIYKNSKLITCNNFFDTFEPKFKVKNSQILIQLNNISNMNQKVKENYRIVTYIPLYLLRDATENRLKLTAILVKRFCFLINRIRQQSFIILIGQEIILDSWPIIKPERITSLITTTSQWGVQPYFFHKLDYVPRKMYWYSNNSSPFSNRTSKKLDQDFSYLKKIKVDLHIVWTKEYGNFLKSMSGVKFKVIDFILFYLPTKRNVEKQFNILVFDVPPKKGYDMHSYYSEKTCLRFIESIVEVSKNNTRDSRLVNVALKPKRNYSREITKSYRKYIRTLIFQGDIKLISPNIDLFQVIKQSNIVIAPPFSTPALIANRLGIKSCYFNPNPTVKFTRYASGVKVIQGSSELLDFVLDF